MANIFLTIQLDHAKGLCLIVFELQEILRRLEDEGTRTLFTDSKSQYHHSIKKASLLKFNGQIPTTLTRDIQ